MQDDFSKENSVKAGHSLKTKTCKLYICLLLSDGVNNSMDIEKAYAQFNTQKKSIFLNDKF